MFRHAGQDEFDDAGGVEVGLLELEPIEEPGADFDAAGSEWERFGALGLRNDGRRRSDDDEEVEEEEEFEDDEFEDEDDLDEDFDEDFDDDDDFDADEDEDEDEDDD